MPLEQMLAVLVPQRWHPHPLLAMLMSGSASAWHSASVSEVSLHDVCPLTLETYMCASQLESLHVESWTLACGTCVVHPQHMFSHNPVMLIA